MANKRTSFLADLAMRSLIHAGIVLLVALLIFSAERSWGRWLFLAALLGVALCAGWEYLQLLFKKGLRVPVKLTLATIASYLLLIFFADHLVLGDLLPSLLLGSFLVCCWIGCLARQQPPLMTSGACFLGVIYIAVPLGALLSIVYFFPDQEKLFFGSAWFVYLLAVTKSADMGGYFIGRAWGRRPLAPTISPNKTVEGAVAGLGAAMCISLFLWLLPFWPGNVFQEFSAATFLFLGLLLGCVGQGGDLVESAFKREAKVKDSNALPAVGGILDLIDSLLFTTPVIYIFLRIVYHS